MGTGPSESVTPILVPIDFSAYSEAALLWAARAAKSFRQRILVLHVVHDPESAPGSYELKDTEGHVQRLEDAAATMLADFVERMRRDHPELEAIQELETSLSVGLPPTRILEVAEKSGANLIVMGSQGRTGLSHLLLGSKAARVAQLSPIPVTIVKATIESVGRV